MMSEGAAKLWFNTIPEKSISSWSQLRAAFIKNFHGTCKRLYTIEDLDRCVHRKGESSRNWMRRITEILHSSTNILPTSAMSTLEKNCRYDPVVQKMSRMRNSPGANDITMGEVLDAANKHAYTDKTKDETEEDKGKGNVNKGGRNNNNNNSNNNNNNSSNNNYHKRLHA